jgi:hypothetical protein
VSKNLNYVGTLNKQYRAVQSYKMFYTIALVLLVNYHVTVIEFLTNVTQMNNVTLTEFGNDLYNKTIMDPFFMGSLINSSTYIMESVFNNTDAIPSVVNFTCSYLNGTNSTMGSPPFCSL